MRLVQKHLSHTGYAILEVREKEGIRELLVPMFTNDLLLESCELESALHDQGLDVTLSKVFAVNIDGVLQSIKEFKEKYGALPRNFTEYLRTGFINNGELVQSLFRYVYK